MPGDLFIRSTRWKVAVVSAGLHILSSLRAGPTVRVVSNHAASIGVRHKLERECMQSQLETMFERMGARVRVRETFSRNRGIDIRSDKRGEYFDIGVEAADRVEYEVIDIRPGLKHLLLMARRDDGKQKFLCGHDERHWFVCAVPGASVSNVVSAMEALQPSEVRAAVGRKVRRAKNRLRRRNEAFVRQGEWFFVPAPELSVNPKLVLRNEPISRGRGGKPHMCQFLYRTGGELVYVCSRHPRGLLAGEYAALINHNPNAGNWGWSRLTRDATVYVRGRVWHPDHKTALLDGWHRVLMNTENQAPGARAVVFLD
jgi:hypothetical protein